MIFMQQIKRISLALTLFLFLFFVTIAHAQISGQCADVVKDLKEPVDRAISVQKAMKKTLNSDQLVDRYNRHVNILVGNLDREASRMQRLLAVAKQRGCDKLVQMMQDHIVNTKNIYNEMMASILLPAPKKPLAEQNDKLESELESLVKIHWKLSFRVLPFWGKKSNAFVTSVRLAKSCSLQLKETVTTTCYVN